MTDHRADGRARLRAEFIAGTGWGDAAVTPLAGDASFRRYFRLKHGARRAMVMDAPPPQEDVRPFLSVARLLHNLDYSAPLIYARDVAGGFLLLEDLGDSTYTSLIRAGHDEFQLYALAIDLLADLHNRFSVGTGDDPPAYSDEKLLTEAALLTDWFLPASTGQAVAEDVRAAYLASWSSVLPPVRSVPDTLVLRDYHIDNLMLLADRPALAACGVLDFQDALIGPVSYDVISLLEDARRDVPDAVKIAMRRRYLDRRPTIDSESFDLSLAILGAQRHAKVIGIFCRLAQRDGKPVYLHHLPRLWRLIGRSLQHPALLPVKLWMDRHVPMDKRTVPATLTVQLAARTS